MAKRRGGGDLEAILRRTMERSGLPVMELARRSGVDHASLSRFLRGDRSLSLGTASRLFDVLGLRVVEPESPADPAAHSARTSTKPTTKKPKGKPSKER